MNNPYFNLIRAVWENGSSKRKWIVGYYLAFIVAQLFLSLTPYTFGKAIDALQHATQGHLSGVVFWLAMGVVVTFLFWLFHGPARVIERRIALEIKQSYRLRLYEELTHLPLKWHQDHHSGNIITRLNRSADGLYRFAESQFIYIQSIIRFVASIGFLVWISPTVGIISFLSSFLIILAIVLFDKKLIPLYDNENEIDNRVGGVLFDYISNMTTVLTLRLGERTHSNLFERMMTIWPFFRKNTVLNETKWFVMGMLLGIIQTGILIGYILHSVHATGTILIGVVVMIFRYQWDLMWVFQELSFHYSDLVRMNTDVKGIQPILDDIKQLAHLPLGASTAKQWHTIDIKHLAFHHAPGEGRGQIFDDVNLSFVRGEKIALIGSSGGGKSTLLNLLGGLYTPSDVKLKIDNVDFDTLEPLQAITTLIPQDPEIFENTIAFNITLDLPTSDADVKRAVDLAEFTSVLNTLPQGLETDIREKGLNLSVGQKQRLALARGLFAARLSSLVLMDEPTSSVDLPTEKSILSKVIDTFSDSTLIVSLHRLHLLPKFDTVIMLSGGKIVASGSTKTMLSTPGPIKNLWLAYQQE